MNRQALQTRYSVIASTLSLVVALTAAGAWALGTNSVGAKQIKKNAVRSAEIKQAAVGAAEIGDGQVAAEELNLPAPVSFDVPAEATSAVEGSASFVKLADVGTYDKQGADSALRVSWSGLAASRFVPCFFELRVDGEPSGSAPLYLDAQSKLSVATDALFTGLAPGPHAVSIWARSQDGGTPGLPFSCTLGPGDVGVGQTVVVEEVVV